MSILVQVGLAIKQGSVVVAVRAFKHGKDNIISITVAALLLRSFAGDICFAQPIPVISFLSSSIL